MPKKFPSKFKSSEESPGFLLWQVTNKWQRLQRAALAKLGLTHVQFVLLASLFYLERDEEPTSQKKLSSFAKTDPMMTSQVIRTLIKMKMMTRKPHPKDSRAYALNVTATGKKMVAKGLPVVEGIDEEFFFKLGKEKTSLTRLLQNLL